MWQLEPVSLLPPKFRLKFHVLKTRSLVIICNYIDMCHPFLKIQLPDFNLQEVMEQQTVSVAILGWTVKDFSRLLSRVNKKSTGRWWFQIFLNGQPYLGK